LSLHPKLLIDFVSEGKPMILVVDDEPAIGMLIELALKQKGFSVLTANSGADAISISRSHRGQIQLVITDVMMPEMDGPSLVKVLAADDPGIGVLFMSGYCNPSDLFQIEGSEFLPKPFSIDRLIAEVGAMLGESRTSSVS
jgi:two-component system, cell cycle sensor histidine kinase and response regulator CckA